MNTSEAERLVRQAANEGKYIITDHAQTRMEERGILDTMVRQTLVNGKVYRQPKMADLPKTGWTCRIEHFTAGVNVGVVTSVPDESNGFNDIVITAVEV